jgi:imidazolonepropionase-like amidohydrolase
MRRNILLLCFFIGWSNTFCQITDSRQRPIVIIRVNVIPMDTETVLENQTVIVENGKISSIGRGLKYDKKALVVDGTGKYLLPGLAEMHAHVPPIDDLEPMKDVLSLFALNGITTIRGMLGHPKHLELRRMLNKGEIIGPVFHTTGPSFNGMSITSPEAGAEQVRKQKAAGYDYLKLHPGLTRAKFDSIEATAHRVGIPFVGHVSSGVGVWRAIEAKYSTIDHLDGFIEGMVPGIEKMSDQEIGLFGMFAAVKADTTRIPELVSALRKNNVWVVPTQSLAELWMSPGYDPEAFRNDPSSKYMDKKTVEQWVGSKKNLLQNPSYDPGNVAAFVQLRRRLIKACHDGGVGLLLGCDAPQVFNVPGFSTHRELRFLVQSGLTPYEALKTGTVNVARYLNKPDSGVIRKGAAADLILVSGNPLRDITQTEKIEGVMLNGKWMSEDHITAELRKLEK